MAIASASSASNLFYRWRRPLEAIALPIAALVVAMVIFGLFCALAGSNPLAVYGSIYRAAFGSWSAWQNTLIRAAPLMLTALCTALPARLGLVIIGNEGALVIGGLAAVIVGLGLGTTVPALMAQLAMALAAIGAGGLWIMLAGALRHYRGVNETISSLLLNYIAIALMNHLVEGPMRDVEFVTKPSSAELDAALWIGNLPGSRIHYGLLYGLIACVIAYVLIQRTTFGFAARTAGGNVRAAKIAGLPVGKLTLAVCFLGGSAAGLAGMVEVAAVQKRINESLVSNYGYAGILVAFVSRHNPLATILVAILLGGILASGGILQRSHELPDATVLVFQGIVFLCVLFSDSLYGRLPWFQERSVM
ncbi:putative ABC transporter permease protein YufP [Halomicronema hongdechloris C2206]|uniref:ABC transporter permease protein YufP n=1 Tax=Halomicronema hongdechloris C2206 TaxID=1641165 RepID=A0A1Z3HQ55_9CYAN|nr:ABC transporter permease [Halomicronema hongdechloris]ASC72450.1 putative ABC transporter permease protein YufP [Halomicronema hongdechloris C2206]